MIKLSEIECKDIDGQLMYFPNDDQWDKICDQTLLDCFEIPPSVHKYIAQYRRDILNHGELSIGLGVLRMGKKLQWMPYVLFYTGLKFQRVFLETVACPECHSRFRIANPLVTEIYFGVPNDVDEYFLMRESTKILVKTCTNCQGNLPRRAIWLTPHLSNEL